MGYEGSDLLDGIEFYEAQPKSAATNAQASLAVAWVMIILYWLYLKCSAPSHHYQKVEDLEAPGAVVPKESEHEVITKVAGSGVLWGAIMFYMYLLDDQQVLEMHTKFYNRDLFLFICLMILVAAGVTLKPTSRPTILSRDQTEEWKGWMQIMFLLYHYFAAKEFYNLIRVLIASYVWMTGYGNFSYFAKTKDYSIWRVIKMLFRLNFLVVFFCLTLDTDYVLYYICPMHTLWFLSVWITMAVKPSWNESTNLLLLKFGLYAAIVAVIWEIPEVFDTVWKPWGFLLKTNDSMHEWAFRSGLDHWSTFVGMLCGWAFPRVSKATAALEEDNKPMEILVKSVLGLAFGGIFYMWCTKIFFQDKYAYNALHPYYSGIPIIAYIYFRNVVPWLRENHLGLLERAGKITLETYLCQFHIWMCRRGDKVVGGVVSILHGYPLLNFVLVSGIYILLSQWLFDLTTVFSSYMIPAVYTKDASGARVEAPEVWREIRRKWAVVAGTWTVIYVAVTLGRSA
jgi:hypothetical protein